MADTLTTANKIKLMAEQLVKMAEKDGYVLTVEQVNQQPPAMGNYVTVVSVRPARQKT